MSDFYIVIVLLFAVSFGTKSIIHVILDAKNKHKIDFASSRGFVYFLPYNKDVNESDEYLKRVCNYLQKASVLFLVIYFIVFMLRFIIKID